MRFHLSTVLPRPRLLLLLLLASASGLPAPGWGLEIRGRVLAREGAPFPGAHVELLPVHTDYDEALELFQGESPRQDSGSSSSPGPRAAASSRSGPHGTYTLSVPSPGLWRLRVWAPGFVAMDALLPIAEDVDVEPVTLQPDIGQPLRLLGGKGGSTAAWAIAGGGDTSSRASGRSRTSPDDWRPARSLVWQKALNGTVRISRSAGEELDVRIVSPGHEPFDLHLPRADPDAPVPLRATPLRVLRLTVLDPYSPGSGAAVEDALVLYGTGVPGATAARHQPFPLARTDAQGRAELLVPRDGTVFLTLLVPDGRRSVRPWPFEPVEEPPGEAPPAADDEPVEWTLPPPVWVVGRALDEATGEPVPGALVWFESVPAGWVQTDAQGLYQLAAPPNVKLVLRSEAAGYRGVKISGQLEGEPLRGAAGERAHEGPLLSLAPVVALAGGVVDEAGEPVPGAEIRARVSGPADGPRPYPVDPVETGPEGRFRLSELTPSVPYRLSARAEGFAPVEIEIGPLKHGTDPSRRPRVEIVLSRGRTVHGLVLDEQGGPIAGARVALLWQADPETRKRFLAGRRLDEGILVFESRTGQDGRFTVIDLPAGRFELVVQAQGFAPYEQPGVELAAEETSKDLGRLELSPGLALEGRVSDRRGRPVAGAEVRTRIRFDTAAFPGTVTRSEDSGRFRLEHLGEDAVVDLHVRHPDYSARVLPNVAIADREFLHVELERPAVLTGRVLSSIGEPVARAWVGAKPEAAVDSWILYSDRRGVDPTTHTDAEGRFRLPDVEPGKVELSVEARGFQSHSRAGLDILPGTETEIEVVLEPGATVSGLVLDAEGRPLSGVSVQGAGIKDRTDPQGHFRLVGISPGAHRLLAWSDEHGRTDRTVDVPPEGAEVELVFPPGYPLGGRVVGPGDEPVAGALVRLEPATETTREATSARSALTDLGGGFGFDQVPPGSYRLLARREGLAMGSTAPVVEVASGPVRNLRLELAPGGVVLGRVLGLDPGEVGNLEVEARGPGPFRHGQVSAAGSYRIEGLSPGDWLVTAEVRGSGRRAQARVSLREGEAEIRRDLELGAGLTVEGRVRENGSPLVDAEVTLFGPTGSLVASLRTDRSGSFRVEGLEPGTHSLEVASFGRQLRHAETLTIERDRSFDIELATGSLAGRVVDATGSPVAGARILLEPLAGPAEGGAPRWLTTEADGSFRVLRVPAGRYRATARAPGDPSAAAAARSAEVTVPSGSGIEGWVIELAERDGIGPARP